MQFLEATVLATQIRSKYPQYSSVDVVPVGREYAVVISRWVVKHDRFCCIEYKKFMQQAEEHGFEVDIPDNGMLLKPLENTTTIMYPGEWAIVEMITGQEEHRYKTGRPRKSTYAA